MRKFWMLNGLLLTLPATAQASTSDWFWPGFSLMIALSIVTAIIITQRFKQLESTGMKVLTFGLFFWVVMFAQAIIYAVFLH